MDSLLGDVTTAVRYLDTLHNTLPVEKKMETVLTLRTPENLSLLKHRWKNDLPTLRHIFEELGVENWSST